MGGEPSIARSPVEEARCVMAQEQRSRAAKLLNRMHRFEFDLVVPSRARSSACETLIGEICAFRDAVLREWGSLPDQTTPARTYAVDRNACHLIARLDGQLVGCIRFIVFDKPAASEVPAQVIANSGCVFSDSDRALCMAALREYFASEAFRQGPLIQFGGLVVARDVRKSVVAPVLCLACNAFARLVGSLGGVSFAAEKSSGMRLYQRAGGFPLGLGPTPLHPLDDIFHRDRVTVLGSSPCRIAPDLEEVVLALEELLSPTVYDHRAARA